MRPCILLFVSATYLWAGDRPIVVKVEPPPSAPRTNLPSLDMLIQAKDALKNDPAIKMPAAAQENRPASTPTTQTLTKAPKSYKPRKDIQLDANAKMAVAISESYGSKPNQPTGGKDGTVVFTFGAGQPTIVCAPLRLSVLELEPGEKLTGQPQSSDEIRWDVRPALVGSAEEARTIIMLRPHEPALEANLVITTDRRIYYLRLVSKPSDYMARITFEYQDKQSDQSWKEYQVKLASYETEHSTKQETKQPAKSDAVECSYSESGYKFKGHAHFRPTGACDDGTFTKIALPDLVHTMGAPVFMVKTGSGRREVLEPTNYDVRSTTYIVHRIFGRGVLISGTGKHQQRIEIESPRAR